jgi:hypothetical protein
MLLVWLLAKLGLIDQKHAQIRSGFWRVILNLTIVALTIAPRIWIKWRQKRLRSHILGTKSSGLAPSGFVGEPADAASEIARPDSRGRLSPHKRSYFRVTNLSTNSE